MTTLPMLDDGHFDEVSYQGKQIKVGQTVIVPQAGQSLTVTVSSLVKRQGHYWVGYYDNQNNQNDEKFCPWPLVRLAAQS